ncbi:hypothetical protein B0H14DRAFT_2763628, partial [Mycena olivaceomarginata]
YIYALSFLLCRSSLINSFHTNFALFSSHCGLPHVQRSSRSSQAFLDVPFVPYICTASLTNSDEIQQLSSPTAIKSSS